MGCQPPMTRATEYEFIASMRHRAPGQCRGPALSLPLSAYRLELLEEAAVGAPALVERLWDGFQPWAECRQLSFTMCAGHWFDLSYTAGVNARRTGRRDWFDAAGALLSQAMDIAGWDPKEIANMVNWQRVSLT